MNVTTLKHADVDKHVRHYRERYPDVSLSLIEAIVMARLRVEHPSTGDEENKARHELLALVKRASEIQGKRQRALVYEG